MRPYLILIVGFSFFGYLIGYMTGITSSEIAQASLTALFAFMGGKIFIDFQKQADIKNKVTGVILTLFSIFFFLGLNTGIYIKINRIFTKKENIGQKTEYLRSNDVIDDLESRYRKNEISCDSALVIIFKENAK